jgi:hypothetical protein
MPGSHYVISGAVAVVVEIGALSHPKTRLRVSLQLLLRLPSLHQLTPIQFDLPPYLIRKKVISRITSAITNS